ncbi:DUF4184 family protein [Acinetobacter puyangensis]|uniref:DUF4184 family protein n=1 Tax=Acinetobacter puyangensis TaxID=1096779 RepID=A0A240E6J3_9GAMM|nr:DUF4184 family protein [Acinetobacter puyangensis]SNX43829.1 protein of unknown function [Acinetobacter puyangensis]
MPFTFAHPAIVLPLAKFSRKFSLTGLIIGSLIPDFEYFLRMRIRSDYSHNLIGIFNFDLPLGLLVVFIFHYLVRDSLIHNLPLFLKSRFINYEGYDWNSYFKNNWIIVIYSLLIGIISHILWDNFSHNTGYFLNIFPILNEKISLFNHHIFIFKIVQHMSTMVGFIFIILCIFRMPKHEIINLKINFDYWLIMIFIVFFVVGVRLIFGLELYQYGHLVVNIISAILIALVLTPILINLVKYLRK